MTVKALSRLLVFLMLVTLVPARAETMNGFDVSEV